MRIDLILSYSLAFVATAVLVFWLVRSLLSINGRVSEESSTNNSGVRALLAVPGAFVLRRRAHDRELDKKLVELEMMVVQSGGVFLNGASGAEIFAARYVLPAVAVIFFVVVGTVLRLPGGMIFMLSLIFGLMLFFWPESGLRAAAKMRTTAFVHELPLALDVMRLVTQAGGDLTSAIESVIAVTPRGPVREELIRCLGEVAIGTSLVDALNHVAARINTSEANAVFSTLAQSLEMGTSVSDNLGSASQLIRHSARVRAQAKAQKAVVAMSFPLLLLILPGIFIVLFAPLVIQFMNR